MAKDAERATFVHVYDLLTDIASGIGVGNKALITASQTSFGTLAVKTADVAIDFLLSSSATSVGLKRSGVGANTLFGVGVTNDEQTSRARIELKIVPIAVAGETGSEKSGEQPGAHPPVTPPASGGAHSIAGVSAEMARLTTGLSRLSGSERESALVEVAHINLLIRQGNLNGAVAEIKRLREKYGTP